MKIIYLLLFFSVLFGCSSCHKLGLCKDEPLTMQRVNFEGNELRTDGFYYGDLFIGSQSTTRCKIILLYKNGVALLPGTTDFANMENYIEVIRNSNQKNTKIIWGTFSVKDDKLQIENLPGGLCGSPVALRTYTILNDSTLVLTDIRIKDGSTIEDYKKNEVYHFRKLSVKPDSVNNIIK